ncbi:unnamed protein product [Adineta steineri]|uniref:Uncharacterized protein n=1 Tax=Adineta steineri TaxID=433720 RepID=A0A814J017_9BILA|nr:unnamed protein product [Adineta steineri]CAF1031497.1 unnamed protein product [Adineta steineri]
MIVYLNTIRKHLEDYQLELKCLESIYSLLLLVNVNKIRYEYKQKLDDYKTLVNDVEQFRLIIEKIKNDDS